MNRRPCSGWNRPCTRWNRHCTRWNRHCTRTVCIALGAARVSSQSERRRAHPSLIPAFLSLPSYPCLLIPAFRCKGCDRYYTARTGTICQKTHQPPSKRVQDNLEETLPTDVLEEPAFEADELYQSAGEKVSPIGTQANPPIGTRVIPLGVVLTNSVGTAPMKRTARQSSRWQRARAGRYAISCATIPTRPPVWRSWGARGRFFRRGRNVSVEIPQ